MDRRKIQQMWKQYDTILHIDEAAGVEFWYARELMILFGYERWENFNRAVCRAMDSCRTSGMEVSNHFRLSLIHISEPTRRTRGERFGIIC